MLTKYSLLYGLQPPLSWAYSERGKGGSCRTLQITECLNFGGGVAFLLIISYFLLFLFYFFSPSFKILGGGGAPPFCPPRLLNTPKTGGGAVVYKVHCIWSAIFVLVLVIGHFINMV